MKFVEPRPFADPDVAARKLVEIASTIEPVQNGRIYIELINAPFLKADGSPDEYRAGIHRALAKGWLALHESGAYVRSRKPWLHCLPDWSRPFDDLIALPDGRMLKTLYDAGQRLHDDDDDPRTGASED